MLKKEHGPKIKTLCLWDGPTPTTERAIGASQGARILPARTPVSMTIYGFINWLMVCH